jgi:hypothetical protein
VLEFNALFKYIEGRSNNMAAQTFLTLKLNFIEPFVVVFNDLVNSESELLSIRQRFSQRKETNHERHPHRCITVNK